MRHFILIALTVVILIPFIINVLGWNLYTYINYGEKDLILASAQGTSHNAWAEHYVEELDAIPLPENLTKTILNVGFLNVYLEQRVEPMNPFRFNSIEGDEFFDYQGIEFPWLLYLLIPITILFIQRIKLAEQDAAPNL